MPLLCVSCAHKPEPFPGRIAILPGNILIEDPSSDWMSVAVQIVLQTDLATSRNLVPLAAHDSSGTFMAGAKSVVRTTLTQRNGRLHASAVVTDNSTQNDRELFSLDEPEAAGPLPLLNELAKRLDERASTFSTRNNRALQAYVRAAATPNPQNRIAALTDAVSLDPSFGLAYIALADTEALAAPQDIPALLETARTHVSGFTPLDRARLNALVARISHAALPQQQAAYRAVLDIAPNDSDSLVVLGSLSFLTGSADAGTQYMERALALNPGNRIIQRAFGEGLFQVKRFRDAEKFLTPLDNDTTILPALATCALMEGDLTRANAIAERLFASISSPDLTILFRGVWLKLSGQPQKAADVLTATRFTQTSTQAIAFSELSIWRMMENDFAGARRLAAQAHQLDPTPSSFGSLITLLANADGPVEAWKQQVDSSFAGRNERAKHLVLGYGLFLGRHYPESAQIWSGILEQSASADLRSRAMLAACLTRQGKADKAYQVNVQPFVPDFGDLYAAVSFSEMTRTFGIGVR